MNKSNNGINIRNESTLHRALKTIYSLNDGCCTEVALDGKVYDIVDAKGGIIEIQTTSLSSLLPKVRSALAARHTIKAVYPVPRLKVIESYTADGTLVRSKMSPLHLSVYNMWREVTRLTPILLNKDFTLEVLEVAMTEQRVLYDTPVQSANGCRRHRKKWNKVDKRLDSVLDSYTFSSPSDYTALLPRNIPAVFCTRDISNALRVDKTLPPSASKQAGWMIWVLCRMGLIERVENDAVKNDEKDKKCTTGGKIKYYKLKHG